MKTFIVCTILVFCYFSISCGIAGHYVQATNSMSPTIGIGDHFTSIEIKSKTLNPIERFDIVIYKSQPSKVKVEFDEKTKFTHRVIGMPNEKIEIKKGKIYINDNLLDESSFEKNVGGIDFPATTIPENEYFLLGDNRPNSLDSRYWIKPTIKREDIYGKVTTIVRKEDYDKGKRW
jgi:signal peptidase I